MKRKSKGVLLALVSVAGVFIVALGCLLWWPLPSCSEDEFKLAVHVTADVLRLRVVARSGSPVDVRFLPGLAGIRHRLRDLISPPVRLGFGPSDPRLVRYSLLATNSQANVIAFVSDDRVVGIGVHAFGRARLAEAIEHVLQNWVPTAGIPIESRLSEELVWKSEEEHAEPSSAGDVPTRAAPEK